MRFLLLAVYRIKPTPGFWRSAAIGAALALTIWLALIIIGSL